MVHLRVPRDAVRILEIGRRGIQKQTWSIGDGRAVTRESGDDEILVLLERTDVERDLVVEQTDAAANHRPPI